MGRGGPSRGGFGRGRGGNLGIWQENVPAVHPPQLREEEEKVVAKFKADKDESPELPLRPGWGTQGQAGVVRANYFTIRLPKHPIYDYTVKISSDPGRGIKDRIFQLLEQHPKISPHVRFIAHDKNQRLVSVRELEQPLEITIDHRDEGAPADTARPYQVTITLRDKLDPNQLDRYCHADLAERKWDFQPFMSALNLIIQRRASTVAIRAGESRYFFPAEQDRQNCVLSQLFFAFKGFYSSARPSLGRIVLNVNVCMTPFYISGTLVEAINRFQQRTQGALPSDFPRRVKLVTKHTGHNRTWTLTEVRGERGPRDVFFDCSKYTPQRTSVANYFAREYNIQLNPNLPVVNVGTKRPTFLPAELCQVIEQPYFGRLSDTETANMIQHACNPPATNAASIVNDGLRLLGLRDGPIDGFDIGVASEMIAIPIRVLQPPQLSYGAGRANVRGGSWNILSVKFKRPAPLATWGVIGVLDGGGLDPQKIQELATGFGNKLKACGMAVPNQPKIIPTRPLPDPRQDPGRRKALESIEEAIRNLGSPLPKMVLFLLSRRDDYIYPGIKTLCDSKLGIHSVCMQLNKALKEPKKQDQYFSNVALKVNAKLGGINHTVDDRALGWLKTAPTMVVGMDVTHPSPGSATGTPSVAAVVASVDDTFAQFPVSLRAQLGGQEMIEDLTEMMVERLQEYRTANKALPKRIIIYRDGVSEGQYESVLEKEFRRKVVPSFKKVGGTSKYEPKVTIVICGKRHHSRFYPTTTEQKSDNGNTLPGTVQDRGLSSPYLFDFHLQAHSGLQGQVRPTHYVVIYDENKFNADVMQQGTHHFSYQYVRATKAVSLVPPAYYADLACERARCYFNKYFVSGDDKKGQGKGKEKELKELVLKEVKKEWKGIHNNLKNSMFYI